MEHWPTQHSENFKKWNRISWKNEIEESKGEKKNKKFKKKNEKYFLKNIISKNSNSLSYTFNFFLNSCFHFTISSSILASIFSVGLILLFFPFNVFLSFFYSPLLFFLSTNFISFFFWVMLLLGLHTILFLYVSNRVGNLELTLWFLHWCDFACTTLYLYPLMSCKMARLWLYLLLSAKLKSN